jgi:hypothetical protein
MGAFGYQSGGAASGGASGQNPAARRGSWRMSGAATPRPPAGQQAPAGFPPPPPQTLSPAPNYAQTASVMPPAAQPPGEITQPVMPPEWSEFPPPNQPGPIAPQPPQAPPRPPQAPPGGSPSAGARPEPWREAWREAMQRQDQVLSRLNGGMNWHANKLHPHLASNVQPYSPSMGGQAQQGGGQNAQFGTPQWVQQQQQASADRNRQMYEATAQMQGRPNMNNLGRPVPH